MSEKYSVGEILYVLPARDMGILTLRVEEELVRKTIEGETVTYVASNGKNSVNLNEVVGHVFRTPAQARDFLMGRAIVSIDTMIEKAVQVGRERFSQQAQQTLQIDHDAVYNASKE